MKNKKIMYILKNGLCIVVGAVFSFSLLCFTCRDKDYRKEGTGGNTGTTEEKEVVQVIKIEKSGEEQVFQEWVDKQFSGWDGSHIKLVKTIKGSMNDSNSFKHIKTTFVGLYIDRKVSIVMQFSGTNSFGATVQQIVSAESYFDTNELVILSIE